MPLWDGVQRKVRHDLGWSLCSFEWRNIVEKWFPPWFLHSQLNQHSSRACWVPCTGLGGTRRNPGLCLGEDAKRNCRHTRWWVHSNTWGSTQARSWLMAEWGWVRTRRGLETGQRHELCMTKLHYSQSKVFFLMVRYFHVFLWNTGKNSAQCHVLALHTGYATQEDKSM